MGCAFLLPARVVVAVSSVEEINQRRQTLGSNYHEKLDELAQWCQQRQLNKQAAMMRHWLPVRQPGKIYLHLPGEGPSPAKVVESDSPDLARWRERFWKLREAQAQALFEIAQIAVESQHPALAMGLVHEAVHEDGDHEDARLLIGYRRYKGGWYTAESARRMRRGQVWHEKYGWLLRQHVQRYEAGQRYRNGRWMSAEDDAEIGRNMRHGWKVSTEHYLIRTNHSLEEGVLLATRLEQLHNLWQQLFLGYMASSQQIAEMFRTHGRLRLQEPQHRVVYFADREQYNDYLRPAQPKIDITLGIYFDRERTTFFFAGDEQRSGTLYHEATHQLFQESRPVAPEVGRQANFWIIEGIACYMESLQPHPGYFTLGGASTGRMPAARQRALEDDFYIPLSELVSYGMRTFQQDPRLPMLYSQSAGLSTFLMHGEQGRYRDAVVDYLRLVYTGKANRASLSTLAGKRYSRLDEEYHDFLKSSDSDH